MCGGSSSKKAANASADEARRLREDAEKQRKLDAQKEQERQGRINTNVGNIRSAFDQFDDNFFSARQKEYSDYYNPQVDDQFEESRKKLEFELAKRGLIDSSVAADKFGKLNEKLGESRQNIADRALSRGNEIRSNVEGNRANLISQAEAGAGLETINSSLSGVLPGLTAPQTFDPLNDLFADVAFGTAAGAARGGTNAALAAELAKLGGPQAAGVGTGYRTKIY